MSHCVFKFEFDFDISVATPIIDSDAKSIVGSYVCYFSYFCCFIAKSCFESYFVTIPFLSSAHSAFLAGWKCLSKLAIWSCFRQSVLHFVIHWTSQSFAVFAPVRFSICFWKYACWCDALCVLTLMFQTHFLFLSLFCFECIFCHPISYIYCFFSFSVFFALFGGYCYYCFPYKKPFYNIKIKFIINVYNFHWFKAVI